MPRCLSYALLLSFALPSVAAAQLQPPASASVIRLAYVSPQRAFYESDARKTAQAKLASLQSETSREVEARNARLKALQDALAQGGPVLGEAARRQREQEIDKFQIDLHRFVEDAQARFLAKFAPAVESAAKNRGLLFVFNHDSGVIAWADPTLDITTDVVTIVNQP